MSGAAGAGKEIVREYFRRMREGDPAMPELLADDVRWWVPPSSPLGGWHEGKPAVLALMARGVDLYDPATPMRIEIEEMVAEGDRIAVQLVIAARTAAGEDYRNHYHFAFRLRGERIVEVREYVDTAYAERLLFPTQTGRAD